MSNKRKNFKFDFAARFLFNIFDMCILALKN